jgi:hypothetical protein
VKDRLYVSAYRLTGIRDISIEARDFNEAGFPTKWAVKDVGSVLNKEDEWEYEPSPSNRDDDFIKRCRYDSAEEALVAFETWFNKQDTSTQARYFRR